MFIRTPNAAGVARSYAVVIGARADRDNMTGEFVLVKMSCHAFQLESVGRGL